MKNVINFIIQILIRLIVLILVLGAIFIVYIFFLSSKNNVSVNDTLTYVSSIGSEITGNSPSKKNLVEIVLDDNTTSSENTLSSSNQKIRYYYDQLDSTSKILYKALEDNIDNFKKENYTISFSTQFNSLLHESSGQYKLNKSFQSALDAFFYDHPELFYIDLTKFTLSIKSFSVALNSTYIVSIAPRDNKNYISDGFSSIDDVNTSIAKVENIKNNMIKLISSDTSDYNKILKVHDTLIDLAEYESSSDKDNSHNIYGTFIERKAVCEGYAKAFKYILDSLNIDCILVSGDATNSSNNTESHMWNYVKINDNWYGVDVTWDDPIVIGNTSKNIIRHDYFCKGTSVFLKSHKPSGKISDTGLLFTIPKLSSKNYK